MKTFKIPLSRSYDKTDDKYIGVVHVTGKFYDLHLKCRNDILNDKRNMTF